MSKAQETSDSDAAAGLGERWHWLAVLGAALILAGVASIVVPAVSEIAVRKVLGAALIVSGAVQIVQAARMTHWSGFIWHLLLGVLAMVGGVLIALDPFAGVIALTMLIAIVLAVHGIVQLALAVRMRRVAGWQWFLLSGVIALAASGLLALKLSFTHVFTPATIAGIALLFAGWAYVAMALAARKAAASLRPAGDD